MRPCIAPKALSGRRPAAAPAPAVRPVVSRRPVVAPRAQQQRQVTTTEVQHRVDRLLGLVEEYVHHWVCGLKEGPTDQVVRALNTVTNSNITLRTTHPLGKTEFEGMDGLRDMLVLQAHLEGGMRPTRIVLSAANEEDDSVFALMEGEACLKSPALGKREGEGKIYNHKAYGIVKFDTLLDDTSCCVTTVNERWQLAPADMALLAAHLPFPVGDAPESEDREVALLRALEKCGTQLFPSDRVQATEFDRKAALRCMEMWCEARCSGKNEEQLLREAFVQGEFRLWDGMGVLPLVCGMKPNQSHGTSPTQCILDCHATMDLVKDAKARHDITCAMMDRAVCRTHNIGFVHWRSHIHPKESKEGSCVLEGMDMMVFNQQGKIMDIWMLRDPMEAEKELFASIMAPKKEGMRGTS